MEQNYNSTVNHAKTRSMFGFTLALNRPGWIFRETGSSQDAFGADMWQVLRRRGVEARFQMSAVGRLASH